MLRRPLGLLLASWLAISIAEPAALHACEMHAPMEQAEGHGGHGGHGGHAMQHEQAPADDAHACTCLGDCCAVALSPLPSAEVASFAPAAVRRDVGFPTPRVAERAAPGLRLPFATAPPILPTIAVISLG